MLTKKVFYATTCHAAARVNWLTERQGRAMSLTALNYAAHQF